MSFDDRHILPWAFGAVAWTAGAGEAGGGLVCASAGTSIAEASRPPSMSVRIWRLLYTCELFGQTQATEFLFHASESAFALQKKYGAKSQIERTKRGTGEIPEAKSGHQSKCCAVHNRKR